MFIIKKSNKKLVVILLIALIAVAIAITFVAMLIRSELPQYSAILIPLGLILIYKLLIEYTKWKFSYIVVNDDSLEHFSRTGLFKENVTSLDFKNIQDVSYRQSGIMNILSGSGIIVLQTSSGEFRFHDAKSVKSQYLKLKSMVSGDDQEE